MNDDEPAGIELSRCAGCSAYYGEVTGSSEHGAMHWYRRFYEAAADADRAGADLREARGENERLRLERDHAQQMGAALYWDTICERDAARAALAEAHRKLADVEALCDHNDGGLNQAHLVQLVEYIRATASRPDRATP